MTPLVIPTALGIVLNCILAVLARRAARRHGIAFSLRSPLAVGILAVGTAGQSFALDCGHDVLAACGLAVAFSASVVSAATDALTGYVFDVVTIPSLLVALLLAACTPDFAAASLGALAAGGALAALYAATLGRGLGLGDVKLACCIGVGLGVWGALSALAVAFVAGGACAGFLLLTGRAKRGTCVRFAPYLAGGMLSVALYRLAA